MEIGSIEWGLIIIWIIQECPKMMDGRSALCAPFLSLVVLISYRHSLMRFLFLLKIYECQPISRHTTTFSLASFFTDGNFFAHHPIFFAHRFIFFAHRQKDILFAHHFIFFAHRFTFFAHRFLLS
jgi:hypothetical protein